MRSRRWQCNYGDGRGAEGLTLAVRKIVTRTGREKSQNPRRKEAQSSASKEMLVTALSLGTEGSV